MDKLVRWTRTSLITLLVLLLCIAPGQPRAKNSYVEQLNQALASHNAQAGLLAAWHLQATPGDLAESFPILIDALDDPDWRVRWLSAQALSSCVSGLKPEQIADPPEYFYTPPHISLTSRLWKNMKDPEPEGRRAAAQALLACAPAIYKLESRPDYGNLGSFLAALGDQEPEVRSAMVSLAVFWLQRQPRQFDGGIHVQQQENDRHARYRRVFLQDLAVYANEKIDFEAAKRALRERGEAQFAAAIESLEVERIVEKERRRAIHQIFRDASGVSAAVFAGMLESDNFTQVEAGLGALAWVWPEGKEAVPFLVSYLDAGPGPYTSQVLRVIHGLGPGAGPEAALAIAPYLKIRKYADSANGALESMDTALALVVRMEAMPYKFDQYGKSEREAVISLFGSLKPQEWNDAGVFLEIYRQSPKYTSGQTPTLMRRVAAQGIKDIGAGCLSYLTELIELARDEPVSGKNLEHILSTLMECYKADPSVRPQIHGLFFGETRKAGIIGLVEGELLGYYADGDLLRKALHKQMGYLRMLRYRPSLMADPEFAKEAVPIITGYLNHDREGAAPNLHELHLALSYLEDPGHGVVLAFVKQIPKDKHRCNELIEVIIETGFDCAPYFSELLHDDRGYGYDSVTYTLLRLGPTAGGVAPDLVKVVLDETEDIQRRSSFAAALAKVGPQGLVDPKGMLTMLKDVYKLNPHPVEERDAKIDYRVVTKKERRLFDELKGIDRFAKALEEVIAAIGEPGVEELIRAANGGYNVAQAMYGSTSRYFNPEYDIRLRRQALVILGEVGPAAKDAVPFFLKLLANPRQGYGGAWYSKDPSIISCIAVEALGKVGVASDEVLLALLDAADSDDPELRNAAVEALNRLADSKE